MVWHLDLDLDISLVLDIPMFWILALYLDIDFGRCWRFMIEIWDLDPHLDIVNGQWYTHVPTFGFLSWFLRCKENPCLLSSPLGLWRMLEVTNWGLASWSWFGYGHWCSIQPGSKFWTSILILKVQRLSMSLKFWFSALEDAGCSWLEFAYWL